MMNVKDKFSSAHFQESTYAPWTLNCKNFTHRQLIMYSYHAHGMVGVVTNFFTDSREIFTGAKVVNFYPL